MSDCFTVTQTSSGGNPGPNKGMRIAFRDALVVINNLPFTKREQLTRILKLTTMILFLACITASAKGFTQTFNLDVKAEPLAKVFKEIEKQTGYSFVYANDLNEKAKQVTLHLKNVTIEEALKKCFEGQPFTYKIINKVVIVNTKEETSQSPKVEGQGHSGLDPESSLPTIVITGKVTDADGNPLAGANVKVKGTDKGTTTNSEGVFVLKGLDENAVLEISFVGYQPITIAVNSRTAITASLKINPKPLDEVIVRKGYYDEKRATTTGDVSTVNAKDIEKQPVNNILLAMEGRVPGMVITQSNGIAGAGVRFELRGINSLRNGTDPLFIIDGVPFPSSNLPGVSTILGYGNITPGNPLSYLNPSDVESVDVLKDADATAIYGSRGANGVVLITTKKGRAGKTNVNVNVQGGIEKTAMKLKLLNTRQYLDMRYEAFKNDGAVPNPNLDYDLTLWDTTKYTDWQKVLIGNIAHYNDVQATISGGSSNTQFLFGAGYHKETTVFPGDFSDSKGSVHVNINHRNENNRFNFLMSTSYQTDDNSLPGYDLTQQAIELPPNAPQLYNSDGSINWALNSTGVSTWPFHSPAVMALSTYNTKNNSLVSNSVLSYKVFSNVELKINAGYSDLSTKEVQTIPLTFVEPALRTVLPRRSSFGNNELSSWIIEPQMQYSASLFKNELNFLIGSTFQQTNADGERWDASGFNSDFVLKDIKAATNINVISSIFSIYKYSALFGRINYDLNEKYLINLTARRDGSSWCSSANQFHNFGAIGIGWVFSKSNFFKNHFAFLSFGKVRGSFGTTGNDQIGDYSFMDLYNSVNVGVPYQNANGILPSRIYTPDLKWEETKKLEVATDLAFFQNRVAVSLSFYRNRSSNQLTSVNLPATTGFPSVVKNLNAVLQNAGYEIVLKTMNVSKQNFQWGSSLNFSMNRNKLVSGASGLDYDYVRKIGLPVQGNFLYHSLGVNPFTGLYEVADQFGNATKNPNAKTDTRSFVDVTPKFFAGFQNDLVFDNFQLSFFIQVVDRPFAPLYLFNYLPGFFSPLEGGNQPIFVLQRWQAPGDVKPIEKFSQNISTLLAYSNVKFSDMVWGNASFVKLKNLSLSYLFAKKTVQKLRLKNARLFIQGQNLFTLTGYKGLDPETLSATSLPTLRVISFGVQLGL